MKAPRGGEEGRTAPIRRHAAAACLALLWALGAAPAAAVGERIRVNGSGAVLDLMTPLSGAYLTLHPEVRIEMEKPLGSSGALKALLAGALDLVASSKPLAPEQAAQGMRSRAFGKTPLVIVTERSVTRSDITTRELEEIYAGRRRSWPGGGQIRVVLRPEADRDTAILRGLSPGMNAAIDAAHSQPGMMVAVTDPESNEAVARMPGAVGASALCSLLIARPPLNALSLNGVRPTAAALRDGSYPLGKDIIFVTAADPPPAVTALLEFVFSPQGRAIAEGAGVWVTAAGPRRDSP